MTSRPRVVVLAALPAAGFDLLRPRFRVAAGSPRADSRWLREHAPGANTVLLPHIGSATATTRDAIARLCAENVIAVIKGREPPAAVG